MIKAVFACSVVLMLRVLSTSPSCVTYDRTTLTTVQVDSEEWQLRAGSATLDRLRTALDASQALEVAQHFSEHCWLGAPGADRSLENWGPTPQAFVASFHEDCQPYHPDRLQVYHDATSWSVGEPSDNGKHGGMKIFDDEADARLGLAWLAKASQECFIGRRDAAGKPVPQAQRSGHVLFYCKK